MLNLVHGLFSRLVNKSAIAALPEFDEPVATSLPEALHFQQGFHYVTVRQIEMIIEIPDDGEGNPDLCFIQRVWWDAVDLVERYKSQQVEKYPCDLTLEMRITGGSDNTLAPYKGNDRGSIAIEPVSTAVVKQELWTEFKVSPKFDPGTSPLNAWIFTE